MSKKVTLGVDIDSTIYEFSDSLVEAVKKVTGDEVTKQDLDHWDFVENTYGKEINDKVFAAALDPEMVKHRSLYPGCKNVINVLRTIGVTVHFISHNPSPASMEKSVKEWLAPIFPGAPVEVIHSSERKLDRLLALDAIGIIDDKPDTLKDVAEAGLLAATLVHPWNEELVFSRDDIYGFYHWDKIFSDRYLFPEITRRTALGAGKPQPRRNFLHKETDGYQGFIVGRGWTSK